MTPAQAELLAKAYGWTTEHEPNNGYYIYDYKHPTDRLIHARVLVVDTAAPRYTNTGERGDRYHYLSNGRGITAAEAREILTLNHPNTKEH